MIKEVLYRLARTRHLPLVFGAAAIIWISGCAVQTDDGILAGPILTGGSEETVETASTDLPRTLAIMPLKNQTNSELAIDVVRQTLTNHFGSRNYRVIHTGDVNARLAAAGYDLDGEGLPNLDALRRIVGADGIITGAVTHYDKTFAGVAARISVGVTLEFFNARDELIWASTDVKRSYAGGVSASPVGLIVNALTAAKHLYGDANLYRAADELGRALASDMPSPTALSSRTLPSIVTVVHSGVNQRLNYGDTLSIGLEGDAGLRASAAVPGIGLIDLVETEPGQYVGEVNIDSTLNVENAAVTGRLESADGMAASFVSPYGLLTIDNEPPESVSEVSLVSRDGGIQVNWRPSESVDASKVLIQQGDSLSVTVDATSTSALVEGLKNFSDTELFIFVEDTAGNRSSAQRMIGVAAPDPRFAMADDVANVLPALIRGTQRLRANKSPYYLNGSSTVATDGVLMIEPGTTIELASNSKLTVLGTIGAYGSGDAPIVLTTKNGNRVGEFLILNSTSPSVVAGLSSSLVNVPIQVKAGAPDLIENSITNAFNAIVASGASRPMMKGNRISGATAAGVIVSEQAQPIFSDNVFTDNEPFHIQNGSTYTINVKGNQFSPAASMMTVLGAAEMDGE
jgi:hypothetical protein